MSEVEKMKCHNCETFIEYVTKLEADIKVLSEAVMIQACLHTGKCSDCTRQACDVARKYLEKDTK